MVSKKSAVSKVKTARWIKEGRGAGQHADYKPWLTVRDFPSAGRVHRVFGHKSQRTHHLFSDLELAVFLLLEWHSEVTQIREQFPLQIDVTRQLSFDSGIDHPGIGGYDEYMSTDFLVDSSSKPEPKFALQAKYSDAINDARTVEKLEIEKQYWKTKSIPWYLITEREIPEVILKNIQWLYPSQKEEIPEEHARQQIEYFAYHLNKNPNKSLIALCKELDMAYDLPLGESLYEMRFLLAKRYLTFDIFKPARKLKLSDIGIGDFLFIKEAYDVSA
ncbi:TnsA endonuclease C-terminal domain-containing protein [Litoribacillus peritrichatus]|uniref:TnsA endonuclease N-terminal domain-containing protein n=1 Tax=Litoribacillus peritrichatus TaxID=718191 RepID=A0ABP7MLE5_9GAMM